MSLTILITTSGIGSRLGELTKYTNKCLVRVDDKPAISHIIESYPEDSEFVITLGHFGNHVQDFLELAYPNKNFKFVKVDNYSGEGSSLGYSISKCKPFINNSFIYHACDTIVKDLDISSSNFIVGCKKQNISQFRTIKYNNNKIYDKGEIEYDLAYVGICGVENYKRFFEILDNLLTNNYFEFSDVDVVNLMMQTEKFKIIEVNEWFDIGNNGELLETRKQFHSSYNVLDKPQESIYFFNEFVIKFFSDSKIAQNRVERSKYLVNLVPEITDCKDNFYKYRKVNAELLASKLNPENILNLLDWAKINLWKPVEKENFYKICLDFYKNKTYSRINDFLKEFDESCQNINGCKVDSIHNLLSKVNFDEISNGTPVTFHGDFIFDNILFNNNEFILLDWRQDFQGQLDAGDIYYDLAKLNHNLILNHDILYRNLFTIKETNEDIKCDVLVPFTNYQCREVYHKWLVENNYDLKKVKLLTAIIWLNMSPLHEYPLNKFLFYFGKYNLSQLLENENA
jgi:dTDP-glucose pyrophosphorylase